MQRVKFEVHCFWKSVIAELYQKFNAMEVKQEAVVLADELIAASQYDAKESAHHKHDWLDNNGQNNWEKRTVRMQEKNKTAWVATLQIANSTDGRKILYDIDPIKKVAGARKSAPTTTNRNIPQIEGVVNTEHEQFSISNTGNQEREQLTPAEEKFDEQVYDDGPVVLTL